MPNNTRFLLKLKRDAIAPVSIATANTTITVAQANRGIYVSNIGATGEVTWSLPAATVGMRVKAIVGAVQLVSLDPVDADVIYGTTGVAQTAGAAIKANSLGEVIELVCLQPGKWFVANFTGVWTTTGA